MTDRASALLLPMPLWSRRPLQCLAIPGTGRLLAHDELTLVGGLVVSEVPSELPLPFVL